jgi:hypothetical protein
MAQKVTTTLIDDLDGSEAQETVQFGLDGARYEIDLNAKNAAALRKALERYVTASRRSAGGRATRAASGGRRTAARRSGSGVDAKAVRVWAKENKVKIQPRGRIPAEILERYRAANG